MNLDIRYGRRFACRWKGGNFGRPTPRGSGSRDRVEAKSSDGNDPEEDEEHEHDELRLLERRLGLRRRQRMRGRHATKGHDYADEEVEVERHDSGDQPSPKATAWQATKTQRHAPRSRREWRAYTAMARTIFVSGPDCYT